MTHPVIAHRGASNEFPENTLPAFQAAFAQGADGIEADIHLTADGRIVVHHDTNTQRQTGQRHAIGKTTWSVLRKLDAGRFKGERFAGTRIPLLQEVLALVPSGKKIYIEVKGGNQKIVAPLRKLLRTSRLSSRQLTVISFSLPMVAAIHKQMPEIETLWIPGDHGGAPITHYRSPNGQRLSPKQIVTRALAARVTGIDLDATQISAGEIDRPLIRAAQRAGLKVAAWTVDADTALPGRRKIAAAKIRALHRMGVEITTNDPALAVAAIRAYIPAIRP